MLRCEQTRTHVERTAHLLEQLGHVVEPFVPPVPHTFTGDFKLYWAMLAFFTPLNNAGEGLPVAVHFSAAHGNERVLLDLAYQLESESPMPAIDHSTASPS